MTVARRYADPKIGDAFEPGPATPIHWPSPDMIASVHPSKGDATAYKAIVARAAELRVLRAYASDLVAHDRSTLAAVPTSRRFLWGIGEAGTTLIWLDPPPNGSTEQISRWKRDNGFRSRRSASELVSTILDMRPHLHVWDGVSLSTCDADRAVALLMHEGETE